MSMPFAIYTKKGICWTSHSVIISLMSLTYRFLRSPKTRLRHRVLEHDRTGDRTLVCKHVFVSQHGCTGWFQVFVLTDIHGYTPGQTIFKIFQNDEIMQALEGSHLLRIKPTITQIGRAHV